MAPLQCYSDISKTDSQTTIYLVFGDFLIEQGQAVDAIGDGGSDKDDGE